MYHIKHMGHLKLNFSVPLQHSAVTPSIFLVSIMNTTPGLFDLCCSENKQTKSWIIENCLLMHNFCQKNIKKSNYR